MWFLLLLIYFASIEPAHLQGRGRIILRNQENKTNPCAGTVEVYYDNKPGYVGDKLWKETNEDVVCSITHCGERVNSEDEYRITDQPVWLNELQCDGKEKSLWDCRGWPGPGLSFYMKPTVKRITCSNDVKLSLNKECAGVLQYSINGITDYICGENFGEREANMLCESLECGKFKEFSNPEWMLEDNAQPGGMQMNCSGITHVDHLWQCASGKVKKCELTAVVCEGYKKVRLVGNKSNVCSGTLEYEENNKWKADLSSNDTLALCQQMHCGDGSAEPVVTKKNKSVQITCPDKVKVVLMHGNEESKCYGEVSVNVNNKTKPVCGSSWTESEAQMVCAELGCGILISSSVRMKKVDGVMDHVKCNGSESSLWHCNAKHKKENMVCSKTPYIVCGASINVTLADGPGRCAGRLEVYHEGTWKRVNNHPKVETYAELVCAQLDCGTKSSVLLKNFSLGRADFLNFNCDDDPKNIYDCVKSEEISQKTAQQPIGILCEKHEVVFLKGNDSCSGDVMIEQGNKNYWLSGSKQTWNQAAADTVCQQMHCGKAKNYESRPNKDESKVLWHKSYNCSSTKKSLFECQASVRSEVNTTTAFVKCSEKIRLNLSNGCWGNVSVCTGENCEGLCADTWTEERSEMLCNSLGCGSKVLASFVKHTESTMRFISVHSRALTTNLTQSSFVKKEDGISCMPAHVVCGGSTKPRFTSSLDKCSGNVEINYEGNWLPVSLTALSSRETKNTICKMLNCGTAEKTLTYFGPALKTNQVVTKLQCPEVGSSLASCDITVETSQVEHAGLRCSDWRTITLEVQDTCRGDVVVYSNKRRSFMSSQSWTNGEGEKICKDMECGNFKKYTTKQKQPRPSLWNKIFKCPANRSIESVWDCETESSGPIQDDKLHVECDGQPKVTLSKKCGGEVRINDIQICAQNWDETYAHRVCQEMNCGNAMAGLSQTGSSNPRQDYFHVSCDEHHYQLGQCRRVKKPCDKGLVSIYCFGGVTFNTTEKCGGKLQVNYRSNWEYVCSDFDESLKDKLCRELHCKSSIMVSREDKAILDKSKPPETSLECPNDCNDYRYCVKKKSCSKKKPATIYCQGYEKVQDAPPRTSTNAMVIIVSVAFVLIAIILIIVFVRFYLTRRQKKRLPPEILPKTGMEVESGQYQDMDNSDEDLCERKPESELVREKILRSTSSIQCEDVNEVAESQRLISDGSNISPIRDNDIVQERVAGQNGAICEDDDSLENYDDIDVGADAPLTTAEVHNGPRKAASREVVARDDDTDEDDNYILPG